MSLYEDNEDRGGFGGSEGKKCDLGLQLPYLTYVTERKAAEQAGLYDVSYGETHIGVLWERAGRWEAIGAGVIRRTPLPSGYDSAQQALDEILMGIGRRAALTASFHRALLLAAASAWPEGPPNANLLKRGTVIMKLSSQMMAGDARKSQRKGGR